MRVTGGRLGGRRLASPPAGVRPTADRVREALFARLPQLEDSVVLDLYAGTGALGIEAFSRGARRVVFVERSSASLAVLRRNLETLGLTASARVLRGDVRRAVRRLARDGERFQLVLADPPYADDDVAGPLELCVAGGLLTPGATVVVERSRRHPVPPIAGLVPLEARRYGDTTLTTLEWLGPHAAAPAGARRPKADAQRAEGERRRAPARARGVPQS